MRLNHEFPPKLEPLFKPRRYKVVRGGRGGAKSWGIARALNVIAATRRAHILCAREYQASIRDSVHKLLSGQVERMGLASQFHVERDVIYGPNESLFAFTGLSDKTAENIKSYEDFDYCWVEEARVLTQRSLNILLPTIRRPGSEIWFSYNPELDTDPIHQFAGSLNDSEGLVIDINYRDNPWFPAELEAERQRAERTMPKVDYENIWEGKLRPAAEGAIYSDEMAAMVAERRICRVPYDPYHMVYPVFDLGWNDKMVIGFWQRHISSLRCIDYVEDDHQTYDWCSREMRSRRYNIGTVFLPHDGGHANPESGRTPAKILEGLGWAVTVLPRQDPEQGIRDTRMSMRQMALDSENCAPLVEHLKRYKRSVPKTTMEPSAPVHDAHCHGADMVRYAAQAAPLMDDGHGMKLDSLDYGKTRGVV